MSADPSTDRPTGLRTLGLWVLLIALFLAIYRVYAIPGAGHDWMPTVLLLAVVGSIGGVGVWVAWLRRVHRRFNAKNLSGLDRLARGDLEVAEKIFAELAVEVRRPALRPVALLNCAYVQLRRGQLAEAANGFARVERTGRGAIGALASGHLAVTCAIANRLDEAQRWIDRAAANYARIPTARSLIGQVPLARAVVACRRGNPAEAVRVLDEGWSRFQSALSGDVMRPLRMVRALALEAAGGEGSARPLAAQLAVLAEERPADLTWMAAEWPELRAFLDRHGLAGTKLPDGAIAAPTP